MTEQPDAKTKAINECINKLMVDKTHSSKGIIGDVWDVAIQHAEQVEIICGRCGTPMYNEPTDNPPNQERICNECGVHITFRLREDKK